MKIPQFKSFVDKQDYSSLEKVFENNYIAEGPYAKKFHDQLLDIIGAKYGCFASNGTLAIYLGLKALGIKPGDEILVQNITFIASANAVEMLGATPIFVDIPSFNDLTIDITKIKLNPNTKALIIAHLFGTSCSNIEEVKSYCDENGIFLIEDSAQALAISNSEKHCGTYGKFGTFSFYADKTITTAEGGFVVTDDEVLYEKMLYLRNQGRLKSGSFVHPEIGYNFRITDLQGALGLSQLSKLEKIKITKKNISELYKKYLGNNVTYLSIRDDFNYIPFRVVVFVNDAEKMLNYMVENGIESRSMFYPLHKQPCYKYLKHSDMNYPNSLECYNKGICLPTWIGITEKEIMYVSDILLKGLKLK